MKKFILGFISALIIGAWVALAITGIISLKTAIIVPVCILAGLVIGIFIFALLFRL